MHKESNYMPDITPREEAEYYNSMAYARFLKRLPLTDGELLSRKLRMEQRLHTVQ